MMDFTARTYRSQLDGDERFIYAKKPHLQFFGGRWHCVMAETMQWDGGSYGEAFMRWFLENRVSRHGNCQHALDRYAMSLPQYYGVRLDDLLASKGRA